jgi:uncharacterized membrane protein
MQHLPEARIVLAFGALLSGLLLNGLAAYAGMRRARRHVPDLLHEYRWWIWAAVIVVVVGSAVVGAYLTYVGLEDATKLPNGIAVIASLFLLGFPFAITFAARRLDQARTETRKPARARRT